MPDSTLGYLIAAYALAGAAVFFYVFTLHRRQKHVQDALDRLTRDDH